MLQLKTQYFSTKLSCQKLMLREIDWGVQNGSITKKRVLPVTTLIFKILISL